MLEIKNLSVAIGKKIVLKNINLEIPNGETHILFGPNGSGKTSLVMTIVGYPQYEIVEGNILFKGKDITKASIDQRAIEGLGIAYQNPPVIKGLKLEKMINIIKEQKSDMAEFIEKLKMEDLIHRDVNLGFSGG